MIRTRQSAKIHCKTCPVSHLCLAHNLNTVALEQFNQLITNFYMLKAGEHVYYQAQKMRYIFALHSGCCKEYRVDKGGYEKINNFYFSGDLLSLESLTGKPYASSLLTLTNSELCVIPYEAFFQLLQQSPTLLRRFLYINSYKIQSQQHIPVSTNAKRRLAAFLLTIFYRMNQRQNQLPLHMQLPMSQGEISNFLGLAHETVSRVLHLFQRKSIIRLANKEIYLTNFNLLKIIAGWDEEIKPAE